jgi:hypothetical protein
MVTVLAHPPQLAASAWPRSVLSASERGHFESGTSMGRPAPVRRNPNRPRQVLMAIGQASAANDLGAFSAMVERPGIEAIPRALVGRLKRLPSAGDRMGPRSFLHAPQWRQHTRLSLGRINKVSFWLKWSLKVGQAFLPGAAACRRAHSRFLRERMSSAQPRTNHNVVQHRTRITGGNLAHCAVSILLKSVIATFNVRATARAGLRQREQWIPGDVQMDHAGNPAS